MNEKMLVLGVVLLMGMSFAFELPEYMYGRLSKANCYQGYMEDLSEDAYDWAEDLDMGTEDLDTAWGLFNDGYDQMIAATRDSNYAAFNEGYQTMIMGVNMLRSLYLQYGVFKVLDDPEEWSFGLLYGMFMEEQEDLLGCLSEGDHVVIIVS